MVPGYEDIIQKYRPTGYKLRRAKMTANDGLAQFKRSITVADELEGRDALFVALHEFGHVVNSHLRKRIEREYPAWVYEYEADQYAIKVMRDEGIPVPRKRLAVQKDIVRDLILQHDGSETPDDSVLKYAFGREWRKHRP